MLRVKQEGKKKQKTVSVLKFSNAVSISPYERVALLRSFKMSFLMARIIEALRDCAPAHFEAAYGSIM